MISNILFCYFYKLISKLMKTYIIKKNLTTQSKGKLNKSKFNVITNEYDFLVKNLKKAG